MEFESLEGLSLDEINTLYIAGCINRLSNDYCAGTGQYCYNEASAQALWNTFHGGSRNCIYCAGAPSGSGFFTCYQ